MEEKHKKVLLCIFFELGGCRLNFEISLFRDTFYLLSVNNVHRSVKLI